MSSLSLSGRLNGRRPTDSATGPGNPVAVLGSSLAAWYRVANASNAGSGLAFTLPDMLSSNHATTTTDARKPTIAASAGNGLPILTCAGDDVLTIPVHAGINGTTAWGLGAWVRRTTTTLNPGIFSMRALSGATGAASQKLDIQMQFSGADSFVLFESQTLSRGAQPASWTLNTWVFMLYEFDGTGATEADRMLISRGGSAQTLTFQNYNGAPTSITTTLQAPSGGTACICGQQPGGGNGWIGDIGPNVYIFGSKMAGATTGLLTAAARTALMNFEPPV